MTPIFWGMKTGPVSFGVVLPAAYENDMYDKICNIKVDKFLHVLDVLGCFVFVLYQPLLVRENIFTTGQSYQTFSNLLFSETQLQATIESLVQPTCTCQSQSP